MKPGKVSRPRHRGGGRGGENRRRGTEPSNLCVIGRYILQPEIFAILDRQERGAGNEIQLTDAMAQMIGKTPFHAVKTDCARYDCGDKVGFLHANIAVGLSRPDIAPSLNRILKGLNLCRHTRVSVSGRRRLAVPGCVQFVGLDGLCAILGDDAAKLLRNIRQIEHHACNRPRALPYASMGWRLNGGPQNIIVLASDSGQEQMWTSAARIVIVTKDGRIKRTGGPRP